MDARTRIQLVASGIDPANLPPGTLIGGVPLDEIAIKEKQRFPQKDEHGMNKTEAAYSRHLDYLKQAGVVAAWWFEPFSLKLAPRTHYRPDFLVQYAGGVAFVGLNDKDTHIISRGPARLLCVEIKGFWREDAKVKFKVARAMFPCFDWQSLRLVKGQWESAL